MSPRMSPRSRRSPVRALLRGLAASALAAAVAFGGPASAGWDDFEFGQKLIEKGYTDYARRVFEGILGDANRTAADKDRARFGMALLGKADTIRVMYDPRVPYADVKTALDKAISDIDAFLSKYPNDPKADDAKMEIGDLRLTFVRWGADIASNEEVVDPADPDKRIKPYDLRKTKPEVVREDMQRAVKSAGESFNALQTGAKNEMAKQLAGFRFVVTQYFSALAHPECSQPQQQALESARRVLADYGEVNEQFLTGAYAQDYLGQVLQQLGDCAGSSDDKEKKYAEALGWFQAVSSLEDASDDHRKLIATGYWHIGRLANAAKDMKNFAYVKAARRDFEQMEARAPRVKKIEEGILAYVEWALIEEQLGDKTKAVDLCSKASDYAKEGGFARAELRANDVLGRIVAGGSGGGGGFEGDPSIVQKVADDLFAKGRWLEAVGAYRRVISAAPATRQGLVQFAIPSWKRIGEAYKELELWFEAAIAFEAIVDEVRSGRVSNKVDTDPTAKVAYEAARQEVAALQELHKRTGDRAVKDRVDARIERLAKDFETGSVGDQLYNLALQRFNQAQEDKARGTSGWQSLASQARGGFVEVAKNAKSEYQDNGYQYLVRVALLLDKPDEAVQEADRATAWWATPEAAQKIAGNDAAQARRRQQKGMVQMWKATALRALKKDAEALALVQGFKKANPGLEDSVYERALGILVQILADAGRIEEAEEQLEVLQREAPDYYLTGQILLQIAKHYREKVTEIQKQVDEIRWKIGGKIGADGKLEPGLRQKLAELYKDEGKQIAAVGDLRTLLRRAEAERDAWREKEEDPNTPALEKEKATENRKKAEEAIASIKPRLADAEAKLAKTRADSEAAEKEREALAAERKKIEKDQAVPLRRLAELYRKLDDVLKDLDSKEAAGARKRRKSDLVFNVAYQYSQLARIEEQSGDDWVRTRGFFEEYLAFPDVKAQPETDERKRTAMRALGEAYTRVASSAGDPAKEAEAYATAVGYLQAGLAKLPQNTPAVVGHLAGDTVVLSWQAKPPLMIDGTWRIPLARANSVEELKANVAAITRDKLPKYQTAKTDDNYWRVVEQFKSHVADESKISRGELDSAVKSMKSGGFDPIFFSEHAYVSQPDNLLSLARAYARSGVKANLRKAFNLTLALLNGTNRVETDGPEWWEARTIALDAQLIEAELEFKTAGDQSAMAKVSAKEVESAIASLKKLYPHIGGPERHAETLAEWKAILERLRALMAQLHLPTQKIDLDAKAADAPPPEPAKPPPPAAPAPAAPAPGAPAPGTPSPAMDGAGMGANR